MMTIEHFSTQMRMQGESIGGFYAIEVTGEKLSGIALESTYADYFSIVRVESGQAEYLINSRRYELKAGVVMVLSPRQLVLIEEFSTDYRATYISVEVSLFEKVLTKSVNCKALADRLIMGHLPFVDDDESHSALVANIMQLFLNLQQSKGIGVREPVQTDLLHTLMCVVSDSLMGRGLPAGICHQEVIYRKFIALVANHYTREHSTRFYAERLCVTPVYLARIVRRYAQKSVKEFILSQVYHEALDLLRYTDAKVGEVASRLGFADIETFSKFFKRYNGQSPKNVQRID
jgi:AraC family transcriptional regulator, transcriptional activator of pobA